MIYAFVPNAKKLPRNRNWFRVKNQFLSKYNYCANCLRTDNLIVHHIYPFHSYPNLELDPGNLITLCNHFGSNCHFVIGHNGNWNFFNTDLVNLKPR